MKVSGRLIAMIATFAVLSIVFQVLAYATAPFLSHIRIVLQPLWVILAGYSPAFAAVVTALLFRSDLREFGWGIGKARFYLFALLFPLVWFAFCAFLKVPFGISILSVQPVPADFLANLGISLLYLVILIPGEEIGWRGFLVPRLMEGSGSFLFTIIVSGFIWAVWHLPTPQYAGIWKGAVSPLLVIPVFIIGMIGIASVYAWLRLASGSLWPCILMHILSDSMICGWFRYFLAPGPVDVRYGEILGICIPVAEGILLAAVVTWYVRRHPFGQPS